MSYIYVLDNKFFKNNIYKIGMTHKTPSKRANELSRSTASPGKFNIVYSLKVDSDKVEIYERRIHLLLNKFRINSNKEYFQTKLEDIINSILFVVNYSKIQVNSIAKTNSLIEGDYTNNFTTQEYKLLILMMSCSPQNSLIDNFYMNEIKFAQGFISTHFLMDFLQTQNKNVVRIIKQFIHNHMHESVLVDESNIKIFKELRYEKCELLWTFTTEYRRLFYTVQDSF